MEYEKDEDFSIAQLIVGSIIIAIAGMIIWGVFNDEEVTTPVVQSEVAGEEVAIVPPVVEPIIQIASLYGVSMSELSTKFETALNGVGNLLVKNDEYELLIESKDGVTSDYVEVQILSLGTCTKTGAVRNSDKALELVGLKPFLKGSPTNSSAGISNGAIEYCGYPSNTFSVGTSCMYNGGYYDVSLSPRTYCRN